MHLIEELRAEHDLIEAVVGSLRTFVAARRRGQGERADGPRFVEFLRLFAGHYHHAREEDTLFVALVERAGLPESGPLAVLLEDHRRTAALLSRIEPLLAAPALTAADGALLESLAVEYSHALWQHIDAENSVLLPESDARLRKSGVLDLASRPMTGQECRARRIGEELVLRYPPSVDRAAPRGDGCVCCPAMGVTCRGLEHEWWNDWEWEEFEDHLTAG
jgi:hemerythrin-like domain-containing protein